MTWDYWILYLLEKPSHSAMRMKYIVVKYLLKMKGD